MKVLKNKVYTKPYRLPSVKLLNNGFVPVNKFAEGLYFV
jgi:hypothetical protein